MSPCSDTLTLGEALRATPLDSPPSFSTLLLKQKKTDSHQDAHWLLSPYFLPPGEEWLLPVAWHLDSHQYRLRLSAACGGVCRGTVLPVEHMPTPTSLGLSMMSHSTLPCFLVFTAVLSLNEQFFSLTGSFTRVSEMSFSHFWKEKLVSVLIPQSWVTLNHFSPIYSISVCVSGEEHHMPQLHLIFFICITSIFFKGRWTFFSMTLNWKEVNTNCPRLSMPGPL